MKWRCLTLAINPFEIIAGVKALVWGIIGMIVSISLSYLSGWHSYGLLQFGPASNPNFWCYVVEHLIVWIIPSAIFYFAGVLFSKSRIRTIDVFGTVAFAQIPMIIVNLIGFFPPMQLLLNIGSNSDLLTISQQVALNDLRFVSLLSSISLVFLIWVCILMYNALRVSCNLKGYKLGGVFGVAIIFSEILSRYIIGLFY